MTSRFLSRCFPSRPRALAALAALALCPILAFSARAGEPANYYNSAEGLQGDALRTALRNIIDGHNSLSYNGAKDRLWDDVDNQGGFVQCVYTGRTSTSLNPDTDSMNTEHTWPQSRGAGSTPPRSDLHHLFITDSGWNSRRGSLIFRNVANPTEISPIGARVNSSVGFEPPDSTKGDIARACFYFHVRYNLPLNDSTAFLSGSDGSTADNYMAVLSDMLEWHDMDPPSQREFDRNDRIFAIQGNRNPFIDRPEFACMMFETQPCGMDDEAPAAPTGIASVSQVGRVALDWATSPEPDIDGYHVYRSTTSGVQGARITASLIEPSNYLDLTATPGTPYFYVVTATDFSGNESLPSAETSAQALPDTVAPAAPPSLIAQEGNARVVLDWSDSADEDLRGYLVYRANQSGGPYGPPLTPAYLDISAYTDTEVTNGNTYYYVVTATDISNNQSGFSPEAEATPQIDISGPGSPSGLAAAVGDNSVSLDWADNVEPDLAGYNIERGTAPGGPYQRLNGDSPLSASDYADEDVQNGTLYYYVVTAEDIAGNESGPSLEVEALPVDNVAPGAPGSLAAVADDSLASLSWSAPADGDLVGYNVYRGRTTGGPYARANAAPVPSNAYDDANVFNGETYFYVATSLDDDGNESGFSAEASASPGGGSGTGTPWINEIHYDNASGDLNEFVEIAGPAGMSVSGWSLVAYNGSNGTAYLTVPLSGEFANQQSCFGTLAFDMEGLQNGSPDGVALVNASGVVAQFLSYEGDFQAVDGPASGMTSQDIGVQEDGTTQATDSLQLGGSGSGYNDFAWQPFGPATRGQPNAGQTFANGCGQVSEIGFGWKLR